MDVDALTRSASLEIIRWSALIEPTGLHELVELRGHNGPMVDGPKPTPRVLICYAHDSEEHKDQVRAFAEFLIRHGVDAHMDSWDLDQRRDWQLWATREINAADFVLVIASPKCRLVGDGANATDEHRGLRSEMSLLREYYQAEPDDWLSRILPVVLPGRSDKEIPLFLQPRTADHYVVPELTVAGADDLLRCLTRQPPYRAPFLGVMPDLPPRTTPSQPPPSQPVPANVAAVALALIRHLYPSRDSRPSAAAGSAGPTPSHRKVRHRLVGTRTWRRVRVGFALTLTLALATAAAVITVAVFGATPKPGAVRWEGDYLLAGVRQGKFADLDLIPPEPTNVEARGDIRAGGNGPGLGGMQADEGEVNNYADNTRIAMWHGPGQPDARDCLDLTKTQGTVEAKGVRVGSILCTTTTEGRVARLTVLEVIAYDGYFVHVIVWEAPEGGHVEQPVAQLLRLGDGVFARRAVACGSRRAGRCRPRPTGARQR